LRPSRSRRTDEGVAGVGVHQLAGHADGAGRVQHVDRRTAVARLDADGGVGTGRGGATDEERDGEALTLELAGGDRHLLERGRDETGQADEVHLLGPCHLHDP